MADRYQARWNPGNRESGDAHPGDPWQTHKDESGYGRREREREGPENDRGSGDGTPERGRWEGGGDTMRGTQSGAQSGVYTGAGAFGSEHRGYAQAHAPGGGSYGGARDMQGGGYGAQSESYGSQSYGTQGGGSYGSPRESYRQAGYTQSGHAQGNTGYGTHGYGGQASGYSRQGGESDGRAGYGGQGGYGPQGGSHPAHGAQNMSGGFPPPASSYGSQGGSEAYGGYGSHGGGYGSQASYASHGGYGTQGHGGESHGGYGSNAGGYGGYGSQAGFSPHPQSAGARPRRGPKGYQRSDERIREDICEHLMHSTHIDSSEVTVEVSGGKVTLEGTVPDRRMKHAIEDLAGACPGVSDVDNRVRVNASAWHGENAGSSGDGRPTATSENHLPASSERRPAEDKSSTASRGPGGETGLAGRSTSSSSTTKPARD